MENAALEKKEKKKTDNKKKKTGYGWKFVLFFFLTCLLAMVLFFSWAWISYHMRFSTELIRVGLTLLYIIPCLIGGKMLCAARMKAAPLWGAGLGIGYFILLLVLSFIKSGKIPQTWTVDVEIPFMCVLSGITGTLRFKKRGDRKSAPIP